MSYSNRTSIELLEKKDPETRNDSIEETSKTKVADFDTAISAAGTGKFHYLLHLSIIPVAWASSFDTSNTSLILSSAECDLELSMFHKGVLNATIYVGMVLSGFLWGYMADAHGRRRIIVYCYLADGICNVLLGFSQNFWTLVFFKFLSGFIVSGPYATIMTYCSEFYCPKERSRIPILVGFNVAFGAVVNAALAWLVLPQNWSIVFWDGAFVYNSWRIYLSLCGVPTLIGAFCLYFFPESPKFLMSQGRNDEALKVFKKIYTMNTGRPADTYPVQELENELQPKTNGDTEKQSESSYQGTSQIKLLFVYPYFTRLLLVVGVQFCGLLTLNTFRLWLPQLFTILENYNPLEYQVSNPTFCRIVDSSISAGANETLSNLENEILPCTETAIADTVYITTMIVAGAANLSIFSSSFIIKFFGYKKLLLISYFISLVCLLSMNWSTRTMVTLILSCLIVGFLSITLNVVISATVMLFPTSLRTMAVSLEMILGRIGSMIGNLLFPILLAYGCIAPIGTLAGFCLVCILLTCFIPNPKKIEG